jgi:hypothetical protein
VRDMAERGDGEDVDGEVVDISSRQHLFAGTNGKISALEGLHAPIDGADGRSGDDDVFSRLQDRFEDARDAVMESEPFAQVFESTAKALRAGRSVWAFSKQAAWILGTSALVLVVPLLYEMDKEMNVGAAGDPSATVGPGQTAAPGGGDSSAEPS